MYSPGVSTIRGVRIPGKASVDVLITDVGIGVLLLYLAECKTLYPVVTHANEISAALRMYSHMKLLLSGMSDQLSVRVDGK